MGEDALKSARIIFFALTGIGLASCGLLPADKSKVRTVHEVLDNMNWWNGSVIRVAGYMPSCGGYDCALFQSKQEQRDFWRIISDRNSKDEAPDFLSIAHDEAFDRKAPAFAGKYVIVTGKVSTRCRSFDGEPQCLDRASEIEPTSIEAFRA